MKLRYTPGTSVLHRLNPMTKLIVLLFFSVLVFLFYGLWIEFSFLLALLLVAGLTGSKKPYSLLLSPFVVSLVAILLVIPALFIQGGEVYLSIPLVLFSLNITELGVVTGLTVATRFICIIFASGIFVFTTDPGELAYSLIKAGVPYRFGFMLVTALRFIPVFESEVSTVRQAQAARGLDVEGGGFSAIVRSARYTLQPLIVSALSKVDVLAVSMEGRAFGCKPYRTFMKKSYYSYVDVGIVAISSIVFICLFIWRISGWQ